MALWSNTDAAASKPKYLSDDEKTATLGVSVDEAQDSGNVAKGLNTPGWVKYSTYTDANGNTRHKSEVLVAFSSLTGDNDTIDPDPVITIGTQPANLTMIGGGIVTFAVAATATRSATLSYAWEFSEDSGATWENTQPGWATGFNTNTITIADSSVDLGGGAYGLNGYQFRVVVSATGATSVTSNAATLTVSAT